MNRLTLAPLLFLPALISAAPAPKPDPARAALLKADTDWALVASAGKDIERIVAGWTDDAVIYPPREAPVIGKVAIRKYVTTSLKTPWFSINWKPAQAVVAASGDVGYTTGTNEVTVPDKNGKVMTLKGRYLTVWRRVGTGPWRCAVDFWNEVPLPPPAPPRPARPPVKKP